MKRIIRAVLLFIAFGLIGFLGLLAFIRLAPADPSVWHSAPEIAGDAASGQVTLLPGGAVLHLASPDPKALLARIDALALATPRTARFAGSLAEGSITYITRSGFWGFPDFTSLAARKDGVDFYARLRFGQSDFGVNAARLIAWKTALEK